MSLADLAEDVRKVVLRAHVMGSRVVAMYVSPEGEKVILGGAARERCDALDIVPRLKIHNVVVKVHEGMPAGHIWWVFQGGKK